MKKISIALSIDNKIFTVLISLVLLMGIFLLREMPADLIAEKHEDAMVIEIAPSNLQQILESIQSDKTIELSDKSLKILKETQKISICNDSGTKCAEVKESGVEVSNDK